MDIKKYYRRKIFDKKFKLNFNNDFKNIYFKSL